MSYNTMLLVPALSHGTQTFMYDGGEDYNGVARPAAAYYSRVGSKQTVLYSLNDFVGRVEIQGTLENNPTEDDWTVLFTINTGDSSGVKVLNGKYSKLRAIVKQFSGGVINDIRITY